MKTIYCLCLFISFINCSCGPNIVYQPAVFTDTIQQEVTVLNDSFIMGYVAGVYIYKDYLIVNTKVNDFHLHIFDKYDGRYIKSFCGVGRGPGEIVWIESIDMNLENGNLLALCMNESRAVVYNVDSILNSEQSNFKNISFQDTLPFSVKTIHQHKKNEFLIGGSNLNYRLLKMDSSGKITERYSQFPDLDLGPFLKDQTSVDAIKIFSPDGSKYAEGSTKGAVLETISFQDSITPIAVKRFHKPNFLKKRGNISSPLNSVRGFYDMTASNELIYSIYLGDHHYYWHKNIGIFDWQCNPICLLKTKYNLGKICLDEESNRIYAAASDAENQTILIYLNL